MVRQVGYGSSPDVVNDAGHGEQQEGPQDRQREEQRQEAMPAFAAFPDDGLGASRFPLRGERRVRTGHPVASGLSPPPAAVPGVAGGRVPLAECVGAVDDGVPSSMPLVKYRSKSSGLASPASQRICVYPGSPSMSIVFWPSFANGNQAPWLPPSIKRSAERRNSLN